MNPYFFLKVWSMNMVQWHHQRTHKKCRISAFPLSSDFFYPLSEPAVQLDSDTWRRLKTSSKLRDVTDQIIQRKVAKEGGRKWATSNWALQYCLSKPWGYSPYFLFDSTLIAHYMGKYCCFCKGIKKKKPLTLFFANWLFYSFIGMAWDIRDTHKWAFIGCRWYKSGLLFN